MASRNKSIQIQSQVGCACPPAPVVKPMPDPVLHVKDYNLDDIAKPSKRFIEISEGADVKRACAKTNLCKGTKKLYNSSRFARACASQR